MEASERIRDELAAFLSEGGLKWLHLSAAGVPPPVDADEVICHSYPVLQFVLDGILPLEIADPWGKIQHLEIGERQGYFSLPHAWNVRSYATERRMLAINFREEGHDFVLTHWAPDGKRGSERLWYQVTGGLSGSAAHLLQAILQVPGAQGTEEELGSLATGIINSLLEALLLGLASGRPNENRAELRWRKIAAYLDEYCHFPIQREDIARLFELSPDHITRIFRQHARESFTSYLNRLRVARAQRLLRTGTLTVQEVAHQCGFRSSSYFIKVFRSLVGHTPGAVR